MKLKIISDGTANGTQVVNAETGEQVDYIKSITWYCTIDELATAVLEVVDVEIEAKAETKDVDESETWPKISPDNGV